MFVSTDDGAETQLSNGSEPPALGRTESAQAASSPRGSNAGSPEPAGWGSSPAGSSGQVTGRLLGRYEIIRQLGSGGMGAVYEAVHRDLGKRAAIKTLHRQFASDPDVRARFLREGQAASRVRHPNVVDVYDVGIEGEQPYLVMELLEGESLARLYKRETPLAPERVIDLLLPVAVAVAAAHDLGVIHRDLKPENVFLCQKRSGASPKVLDFGISKLVGGALSRELTSSAALLGTPYYMSPEQAQHIKRIDTRTDQYSLAVMLYEGLTALRPFEGDTLYTLLNAIVAGGCKRITQLEPSVPPELEAVVTRAMSTDPSRRYPDMRAFAAALLPFASERTRLLCSDEIAPPPSRPGLALSSGAPPDALAPATSTLREASAARSARRRRWMPAVGAIVGAVVGAGGLSAGLVLTMRGSAGGDVAGSARLPTPSSEVQSAPSALAPLAVTPGESALESDPRLSSSADAGPDGGTPGAAPSGKPQARPPTPTLKPAPALAPPLPQP